MSQPAHAAKEPAQHERLVNSAADVHAGVDELAAGFAHQAAHVPHTDSLHSARLARFKALSPNTTPELMPSKQAVSGVVMRTTSRDTGRLNWLSPVVAKSLTLREHEYLKKATAQTSGGFEWEVFVPHRKRSDAGLAGLGLRGVTPEVSGTLDDLSAFWPDIGSRMREIRSALRADFGCDIHPRSLRTLHQVLRQVPHVPQPRLGAGDDGALAAVWALGDAGIFTAEFLADGKVGCVALLDRGQPSYSETLEASPACALLSCLARLGLLQERRHAGATPR